MKAGPVQSGRGPGRRMLPALAVFLLAAAPVPAAAETEWLFGGHIKAQSTYLNYPANSLFRDAFGSGSLDNGLETRLKVSAKRDNWDFDLAYQFIALYADTLVLAERFPDLALPVDKVISDDRRWWNLTYSAGNEDKTAIINRLDRLSVGYSSEHTVWRFGRQAISWGNGMIFTPMDIFNPFDPAAVDKEYKTGDDMLYGQYLFDSGNDVQGVMVVRRNPRSGEVESDQSSLAFKYHGFLGANEFDLLAAQHYGDTVLGLGGIAAIGGAIWRGDITWTDTSLENVFSAATSLSYSWNWGGKNISGVLEYYYNGFGQTGGAYSIDDLLHNPELLVRLDRGELYTLARQYLAASAMIEISPLFRVTPNVFINLEDPSALAQLVVQYDWKQNLLLLGSLNMPIGPDGSEYGGTVSPVKGLYFSTGPSLFAQLAWYF
jgi:hypothetical protein